MVYAPPVNSGRVSGNGFTRYMYKVFSRADGSNV